MSKLDRNNKLTSFQVFVLVLLPSFSSVVYMVSGMVVATGRADGWISIIVTGLLASFSVFIIMPLARKFPNDTVFTFSKKILGKYLGTIINLAYIVYSILFTAYVLRILLTIVYTIAFRKTPMILLILLYLLTAVYISTKNVIVIARVAEIVFIPLILVAVITPLLKFNVNLDFLLPIGSNGIGTILRAIIPSQNIFLGLYMLLIFIPYIKNKKTSTKYALAGVCITTLIIAIYYIIIIGFFGSNRASMFFWPLLKYISTISTPIFTRIDVILIMITSVVNLVSIYIGFYSAKIGLIETLGLKGDKKNYLIIIIIFLVSVYLTQFPNNYFDLLKFNKILVLFSIVVNSILPLIFLIFSLLNKRKETV